MFCVPSVNCRVFAQVVHTLSKIGDDVLFEPQVNRLVLKTKNMAESSYAEVEFLSNFFSSYSFNPEIFQEDTVNFKLAMRSLMSVVKSPHSFDKNVENCLLKYEEGKLQLTVIISYTKGSTKEYIIPHIEYESFEASFSKSDAKNFILSDACTLITATNQFKAGEDEISLSCEKESSVLENHLQNVKDCKTTVKTTVRVDHQYLENYSINLPTKITFCLKEFKALLILSEIVRLPIGFYFDGPGKPLIVEVCEPNVFRVNVLISTLQDQPKDHQSNFQNISQSISKTRPQNLQENVASTSSMVRNNQDGSQSPPTQNASNNIRHQILTPEEMPADISGAANLQECFQKTGSSRSSGPNNHSSSNSNSCHNSHNAPGSSQYRSKSNLSSNQNSQQNNPQDAVANALFNLKCRVKNNFSSSESSNQNYSQGNVRSGSRSVSQSNSQKSESQNLTNVSNSSLNSSQNSQLHSQSNPALVQKEQTCTQTTIPCSASSVSQNSVNASLLPSQSNPALVQKEQTCTQTTIPCSASSVSQNSVNASLQNNNRSSHNSSQNTSKAFINWENSTTEDVQSQGHYSKETSQSCSQWNSSKEVISQAQSQTRYNCLGEENYQRCFKGMDSNRTSNSFIPDRNSSSNFGPQRLYSTVFRLCFKPAESLKKSRPKILVYDSDGLTDSD